MGGAGGISRRRIREADLPEAAAAAERKRENIVKTLKQLGLTLVQLAKQIWALPQTLATAAQQRRVQVLLDERESERLDRIRNPDKYRGKEI
jgi:hypothetical protein